jgi:hypothetical protein
MEQKPKVQRGRQKLAFQWEKEVLRSGWSLASLEEVDVKVSKLGLDW